MRNDHLRSVASFIPVPLLVLLLFLVSSCVAGSMITTRQVGVEDLEPATYSVIRYNNLAVDYLTAVAFLDREDDAFTILPRDPEYTYRVNRGLQGDEALRLAQNFVRARPSYSDREIKEIRDPAGNLLGYEVRPLYQSFVYGERDVLDITYYSRPENRIVVWIRLKNRIDQLLLHDAIR